MTSNISVFISGGGSNLKALLESIEVGEIDGRVCAVIADRDCAGKQYAITRNIPYAQLNRKVDKSTFADNLMRIIPNETDLIVLAGFLSIMPESVVQKWRGKIINLHPSLLPKYGGAGMYGLKVHQAVIDAGDTQSGCTVHYVDTGIDTGEIIAQKTVPVYQDDSAQTLQQRIQVQEHILLCKVVASLCSPNQSQSLITEN